MYPEAFGLTLVQLAALAASDQSVPLKVSIVIPLVGEMVPELSLKVMVPLARRPAHAVPDAPPRASSPGLHVTTYSHWEPDTLSK
jgi:hypothetical protein